MLPDGGYLGCNPMDLPECIDGLMATDNCDGQIAVACSAGEVTGDNCNKQQIFTYSAEDECGNEVSDTVTYTWKIDTTAPVLPMLPDGGYLGCNPMDLPECVEGLMATDNCDGQIAVACEAGLITGDDCNKQQIFTYSATDVCGNTASDTVTYTWTTDTVPPVITCPLDATIYCPEVPVFTPPQVSDNCDTQPELTYTEVTVPGAYDGEYCITRTWTATDDCGNYATCSQTICVVCHDCETAWGRLEECLGEGCGDNWGSYGVYTLAELQTGITGIPVYAGAGQCEWDTKGTLVGYANIQVTGDATSGYNVIVDYDNSGYTDCRFDLSADEPIKAWVSSEDMNADCGFVNWYKAMESGEAIPIMTPSDPESVYVGVHFDICCGLCPMGTFCEEEEEEEEEE
jgi:hypothetical protein